MLKKDIIKEVSTASGYTEAVVREVIESIRSVITSAVASSGSAMLLGLGKLSVSSRGPKKARDLHTGKSVVVPARKVVTFRPSAGLASSVNGD